jgi:hypothetical protein
MFINIDEVVTNATKQRKPTIQWKDICQCDTACDPRHRFKFTVPDYETYCQASDWMKKVRKKYFSVWGVSTAPGRYTGEYRFEFICEREYVLFVLRWAS